MTWGWGGSLTWHFCFVGLLASGPPKRNWQPGTVGVSPRASLETWKLECWILCVMTTFIRLRCYHRQTNFSSHKKN